TARPRKRRTMGCGIRSRARELGWIEGRSIAIEYRDGEGRNEPLEIAAEFVRLKVDFIVTHATAPTVAAKQATSVVPIVFATASGPVVNGLVATLARPGDNVTGLSNQGTDIATKQLEPLPKIVPGLHQLATNGEGRQFRFAGGVAGGYLSGRALGLEVTEFKIRRLISYGPSLIATNRRAAEYIDKVLKGTKPGDLPVE